MVNMLSHHYQRVQYGTVQDLAAMATHTGLFLALRDSGGILAKSKFLWGQDYRI